MRHHSITSTLLAIGAHLLVIWICEDTIFFDRCLLQPASSTSLLQRPCPSRCQAVARAVSGMTSIPEHFVGVQDQTKDRAALMSLDRTSSATKLEVHQVPEGRVLNLDLETRSAAAERSVWCAATKKQDGCSSRPSTPLLRPKNEEGFSGSASDRDVKPRDQSTAI